MGAPDTTAESLAPRRAMIERDLQRARVGDVEFDVVARTLYATDAGLIQMEPLGVVAPRDTEGVAWLVEYAARHELPLVARGAGSGLAGAAVGPGIQVDFSRYMNRILEVAPDGSWARVQPGLTMGELNRHLADHGVFFAPDPSSGDYCTLGGMCGTNSSGARSVAYGATKDHVSALEVVMADGEVFSARPVGAAAAGGAAGDSAPSGAMPRATAAEAPAIGGPAPPGLAARGFASLLPVLRRDRERILASLPRVVKNCSGYRLEALIDDDGTAHLQRLFVGAEGTLGLITEITVSLTPLPGELGITMVYFPSTTACGEAATGVLELAPSAVEIMDSRFLDLARRHSADVDALLPPQTDTAILVEFEAADRAELDDRFAELRRHLASSDMITMVRPADAGEAARLWHVRRSAVALAQRAPGPRRALPFIEDVTVHPTEVPGYIEFLQRLFDRHKVQAVMYGHVGDGNIHTRPLLDPKDSDDLRLMQQIYEAVTEYVLDIRGTMSGEHGDGWLRTPYIRRMYGAETYSLFEQVKAAFDPQGILNPGKKIGPQEDETRPVQHLRFGPDYRTLPQKPVLRFSDGGYEREIEKCHGCGQCKSVVTTTMCPTYKATRLEQASPRAKANLLRGVVTGALSDTTASDREALRAVTEYCIGCGMCAVECPSHVDIPKLMLEAAAKYRQRLPRGTADAVLGRADFVARTGQLTAPLSNRLLGSRALRAVAQPLLGIERRRHIAPFARRSLTRIIADRAASAPREGAAWRPQVAYFYDLFARYNEPEIALAVERVLQAHGIEVTYPEQEGSGIPEMMNGLVTLARHRAETNVRSFAQALRAGATPVSSEPTASFAFKTHYEDYTDDPAVPELAQAFCNVGEFLLRFREEHPASSPAAEPLGGLADLRRHRGSSTPEPTAAATDDTAPLRLAYHLPCHLKAQQVGRPAFDLLREIPGADCIDLDAGCCGMAGTFGMKTRSFDLSLRAGGPLFDRLSQVAPDIVVSDCSTCRMQIAQATGLPVVHPFVLLAEAYRT